VNTEAAMTRRVAVASLLVAVAVSVASLFQTPRYEASALVRVKQEQGEQQTNLAVSGEELQTEELPWIRIDIPEDRWRRQELALTMPLATDTRPVAKEAIRRLGLRREPDRLLDNLTAEQVENTSFMRISYEGTDPVQAKQIANTVGEVSSEHISETSVVGSKLRVIVYERAAVPTTPVSTKPLRNGLLTLVVGLALSAGLVSWGVLRR
jgi:capsular polysaccharide biosynthesis protein